MSYYDPTFGNIEAGWYSDDAFERCWTPSCDALLAQYAQEYAPFLLAYVSRFQKEVLARYKIHLKASNLEYAVLTKATRNPRLLALWRARHAELETEQRVCLFCDGTFSVLDTHPNVIRTCGPDVRWCRGCNYHFWRYASIWSEDLQVRILSAKTSAHEKRICEFCGKGFNLLKHFYSSRSFSDRGMVLTALIGHEDFSPTHAGIDFLYPNLYVRLCPECFGKCFHIAKRNEQSEMLGAIKALGEMIGKIPTQDFDSYIYLFSTERSVREFLLLMQRLPSPEEIKTRFGSFFGCIARSGLLPDGAKRMKIGTMVEAEDGDICFSLVEREIDNWMFSQGIRHKKEVRYPESDFRCDWEVFGCSRRVFVEYFGLMTQGVYAEKAKKKAEIAKQAGITLIEIFPETAWKTEIVKALAEGVPAHASGLIQSNTNQIESASGSSRVLDP